MYLTASRKKGSNNTNKFNPQEPQIGGIGANYGSNNTNKFNPQEHGNITVLR